jgi:hypothetical protein
MVCNGFKYHVNPFVYSQSESKRKPKRLPGTRNAVLKGKPHVFESSRILKFYYFDIRPHVVVIVIIPAPYSVVAKHTNTLISFK